jgi:hypothetical protein
MQVSAALMMPIAPKYFCTDVNENRMGPRSKRHPTLLTTTYHTLRNTYYENCNLRRTHDGQRLRIG